jgi:glycogen(starch) synthase
MTIIKHIVLSTYTFLPDIGGIATNKYTLAKALVKAGHKVTVVTPTVGEWKGEFALTIISKPSVWQLISTYRSADIVLFSNLSIKLGWPAVFLNGNFGLHHHSSSAFNRNEKKTLKTIVKSFVENALINKSTHFVNSEFTQEDAGEFFNNHKVIVTYPIASQTKIPNQVINNYTNKKDAVFVGRIEEEKGVNFLVDNIDLIKSVLNINTLYFAGDGGALKRIEEKKIDGVKFMGPIDLVEVKKIMANSEYVFVPSIWKEPFGNVAVEGVSSGAVVIASNRGGLPEAAGNCSILFDFENGKSFEQSLIRAKKQRENCMNDIAFRQQYFNSANEHLNQFTPEKIAQLIVDAYT